MDSYQKCVLQVTDVIKPYIAALNSKNDRQIYNDINAVVNKELDKAVLQICRRQVRRSDITSEMKKYLIGKMYKSILNINKNGHLNSKFARHNNSCSYKNCYEIAENLGKEFNVSGMSVTKYDLYSRSIDNLYTSKAIPAMDILLGIEKIPIDSTIKLSKMSDDDIDYLKLLFSKQFYKLAGYVYLKDEDFSNDSDVISSSSAMIKYMPPHDPDSMINSLSFTIPSWIKSIQTATDKSDMLQISASAVNNLRNKLKELRNIINTILERLEGIENE